MRRISLLLIILSVFAAFQASQARGGEEEAETEGFTDWDDVPAVSGRRQLADYINSCMKEGEYVIPVRFRDGFMIDIEEFADSFTCFWVNYETVSVTHDETRIIYTVTPYPGDKVARAYLRNDTSELNAEELELYRLASSLARQAMEKPTVLQRELFIHDTITDYVKQYDNSGGGIRNKTALGVFFDGKANCQGFSDAFYMLGTMCGLEVWKMHGLTGKGEKHVWNTIELDGRVYCVDVTWADTSFRPDGISGTSYIYFNAPAEIMKTTHSWSMDYEPEGLQQETDGEYFFLTGEYEMTEGKLFGTQADSADEALEYIAYRTGEMGMKISYVMAPYDENRADAETAKSYLLRILEEEYGWSGRIRLNVQSRGKRFMFFTAEGE